MSLPRLTCRKYSNVYNRDMDDQVSVAFFILRVLELQEKADPSLVAEISKLLRGTFDCDSTRILQAREGALGDGSRS
jgi:hypothetical protein